MLYEILDFHSSFDEDWDFLGRDLDLLSLCFPKFERKVMCSFSRFEGPKKAKFLTRPMPNKHTVKESNPVSTSNNK